MKRRNAWILPGLFSLAAVLVGGGLLTTSLVAQEISWTKVLEDRAQRGKLHDMAQLVRGDSGRWQEAERWLHAPAPDKTATRFSLDDWMDQWSEKKFAATEADDNWLFFSTRQLSDHDRVWIERIERRGNRITVVVSLATWRGKYFKNFTYYPVLGVNVGRLEPGTYEATCVIRPSTFTEFEGTGKPLDNWPKDDQTAERKPLELFAKFTIDKSTR